MFSGFFGLNRAYVDETRNSSQLLLAFCMWLTGVGSCAGTILTIDLPIQADNFPSRIQCCPQCCSKELSFFKRFSHVCWVDHLGTATAFPVYLNNYHRAADKDRLPPSGYVLSCTEQFPNWLSQVIPRHSYWFLVCDHFMSANGIAVMTTVSEFIGFLVISVFPEYALAEPQGQHTFHRPKSDDPLLANDEQARDGIDSDDELAELAGESSVDQHTRPYRKPGPAFSKPEFWILTLIMSMRT